MEACYQSQVQYTFEEYKKMYHAISIQINKVFIKVITLDVCFCLLAYMYLTRNLYTSLILLVCAILFPIIFYFTLRGNVKRSYISNLSIQNLQIEYTFFKDNFTCHSKLGDIKIEYRNVYRILETKTNFYFMLSQNQGMILKKENCSEELMALIQNLKKK